MLLYNNGTTLSGLNVQRFHNDRIQLGLNTMTPIEYRRHYEKMAFL